MSTLVKVQDLLSNLPCGEVIHDPQARDQVDNAAKGLWRHYSCSVLAHGGSK